MNIRVGEGWDTHALVEGRPLMLGGVHIPHDKGLLGHSDADVLLHAINMPITPPMLVPTQSRRSITRSEFKLCCSTAMSAAY